MDPKKPINKITEMVSLQMLKKWKRLSAAPKGKSINFLKRTLPFSDAAATSAFHGGGVPKGYLAVCVGEEMRRFVIPTEYLGHRAFGVLLRQAEEEFGFQQEGVLRIPCEVSVFESTLKVVGDKSSGGFACCPSEAELGCPHQPQKPMCR